MAGEASTVRYGLDEHMAALVPAQTTWCLFVWRCSQAGRGARPAGGMLHHPVMPISRSGYAALRMALDFSPV